MMPLQERCMASCYVVCRDLMKRMAQGRLAFELDPLNHLILVWSGAIFYGKGDFKMALALAEEITAVVPGELLGNRLMEFAAFQCKEYDKVMKTGNISFDYQVYRRRFKRN